MTQAFAVAALVAVAVCLLAGLAVLAFAHGLGWLAFLVAFAAYVWFMLRR